MECGKGFCVRTNLYGACRNRERARCNICDKQFSSTNNLNCHIRAKHAGESTPLDEYKGSLCDKLLCSKNYFNIHMKRKHKDANK